MSLFDYRDFLGALGGLFSGGGSAPKILSELIQQLFGGTADGKILDDELDIVGPAELQGVNVLNFPAGGIITTAAVTGTEALTQLGTATLTADDGFITVGVGTVCQISIDGVMTYPCEEGPNSPTLYDVSVTEISATHNGDHATSDTLPSWFHEKGGTERELELDFLSTWGSLVTPNLSLTIPTDISGVYNGTIDWGDGDGAQPFTSYNDANLTHTYVDVGYRQVRISGTFSQLDDSTLARDGVYCRGIQNLGYVGWTTMIQAFRAWYNIESFDAGTADFSKVSSMYFMAYGCTDLTNVNFNLINAPVCLSLEYTFGNCASLTDVVFTKCNVSKATTASNMMGTCTALSTVDFSGSNFAGVSSSSTAFTSSSNIDSIRFDDATFPTNANGIKAFTASASAKMVYFNNVKTASSAGYTSVFKGAKLVNFEMVRMPSNITSLSNMFEACTELNSLDLSHVDLSKITTMERMLFGCGKLTEFNLIGRDLSSVVNMSYMIHICPLLTSVAITDCDLSSLLNISNMFSTCVALTSIDFSGSDFRSVSTATSVYAGSNNIATINVNNVTLPTNSTKVKVLTTGCLGLKTCYFSNVKSLGNTYLDMFENVTSLTNVVWSNMPSNITDLTSMFENCGLETIDLSNVDLSNVTNMSRMFFQSDKFTSITFTDKDMSSVTNMGFMFYNCILLETISMTGCDCSSATSLSTWANNDPKLALVDLHGSDFRSVTTSGAVFTTCPLLTTINLNDVTLPTNEVALKVFTGSVSTLVTCYFNRVKTASDSYKEVFKGAGATTLETVEISGVPANIARFTGMFQDSGLRSIDLTTFDLSNATTLSWMFGNCDRMPSIALVDKDMSSVVDMSFMFYGCALLESISITGCDVSNTLNMSSAFNYCPALTSVDYSGSDFTKVTTTAGLYTSSAGVTTITLNDATLPVNTTATPVLADCASLVTCYFNRVKSANNGYKDMFNGLPALKTVEISGVPANITGFDYMFYNTGIVDIDLSNVDFANVTKVDWMFATSDLLVNLDLSSHDFTSVTTMERMFYHCDALETVDFTGVLVPNVTTMQYMFDLAELTTASYSALLKVFADQTVKPNVPFGGGTSKYTAAGLVDRDILTSDDNWTILDGGLE